MNPSIPVLAAAAALAAAAIAPAANDSGRSAYDESTDGDLSDDPNAPTPIALNLGSNTVAGDVFDSDAANGDRDFITFTVPQGTKLDAIILTAWGTTNRGFLAVNAGTTGFIPSGATNANFLAGALFDDDQIGTDILERFTNNPATANSLPAPELGPGDYTFVIQQTTTIFQPYAIDLVLIDDPVITCPGDTNGDNAVTPLDISIVLGAFGATGLTPNTGGDVTGDGSVTPLDISTVLGAFGTTCP